MPLEEYYRGRVSQECYDLFAVFSRFEYAMKNGGFRRERYPDAAWPTFADALGEQFFEAMKKEPAASELFEAPPDHLICAGAGVDWSQAPQSPTNVEELFQRIKDVRNNLFHGDKKHDNRRDTRLAKSSLAVLNAAFKVAETNKDFERFISAMEYGL